MNMVKTVYFCFQLIILTLVMDKTFTVCELVSHTAE